MLLVGSGVAAQTGCGGRYEIIDGSAGTMLAAAGVGPLARAGAPDVVVTQPGNPAGAPSFGGSFGVAGGTTLPAGGKFGIAGGGPVPAGGAIGIGGGTPVPAGGASGAAGATMAPSVCDGLGTHVIDASNAALDDFEEATILSHWSAFADLGPPGVDGSDDALSLVLTKPGAAGTNYGAEYLGMGANPASKPPGFGVGAVLNVAIDPMLGIFCADISAFDGISFWAKTGVSDAVFDVNFVLPSTNASSPDPNAGGGDCVTACYNHPHKRVALTGTWAEYAIRFSDAAGGSAKVGKVIQEIGWFSPDSRWDFSLDEITFYKGTPPVGPVGNFVQ
jgi:hypothetical protein